MSTRFTSLPEGLAFLRGTPKLCVYEDVRPYNEGLNGNKMAVPKSYPIPSKKSLQSP